MAQKQITEVRLREFQVLKWYLLFTQTSLIQLFLFCIRGRNSCLVFVCKANKFMTPHSTLFNPLLLGAKQLSHLLVDSLPRDHLLCSHPCPHSVQCIESFVCSLEDSCREITCGWLHLSSSYYPLGLMQHQWMVCPTTNSPNSAPIIKSWLICTCIDLHTDMEIMSKYIMHLSLVIPSSPNTGRCVGIKTWLQLACGSNPTPGASSATQIPIPAPHTYLGTKQSVLKMPQWVDKQYKQSSGHCGTTIK